MCRYALVSIRPITYANSANVAVAIAISPAARPSRPSVMLTALLVPVNTKVTNATYSQPSSCVAGTISMYL